MPKTAENIFKDINFQNFGKEMTETLSSAIEQYWEKENTVYLQAVNDFKDFRKEKIVNGIDFFSSKIKSDSDIPFTIRLSKDFVRSYLNEVLMSENSDFAFSSLTPLEIKILNNFNEYLYKKLKEILNSSNASKSSKYSEKVINLIFCTTFAEGDISHLALSVPYNRLKFENIKKNDVFSDEYFKNSSANVNIHVGSTKITLEELQELSPDDIIVFEDSNLTQMTLISGGFRQNFKIKINSSLIIESDDYNENEETVNEVTMEKNLWDDIQIEINAEFEKVKMTIGELKQISQGQIIDLGSIFDNEISLFVEDKKVAKGELIIINDRYAVKLNEVLSKETPKQKPHQEAQKVQQAQTGQPKPAAPVPPKPAPKKTEDEEFDYSDFEK